MLRGFGSRLYLNLAPLLHLEIVYSSFQERPLLWNQAQAFDTQGSLEKKKRTDEDSVRFPRELFVLVFVKVEQA